MKRYNSFWRDLSDQIVDHLKEVQFITTPPNRRSAFFLNKKKIIDFFAKGWIDAKQIPVWGDQLKKILFKLVLHDENNEFPTEKLYRMLLTILDFHLELELVMAKQAKVSNIKHLGFASYFLREAKFIFRGISAHSLFQLSKRYLLVNSWFSINFFINLFQQAFEIRPALRRGRKSEWNSGP